MRTIPNSVIGAVASVLAENYYSHTKLNSLFMESGAPGEVPEGNCETKCSSWLKRCNEDDSVDALEILGRVLQPFMDQDPTNLRESVGKGQERIRTNLARNQLEYRLNGHISLAGSSPAAKSLSAYFLSNDFASVETEFHRAISQLDSDPHAAITAASAIIEAFCKTYIAANGLEMPSKQTIVPLWKTVQHNLGLNPDRELGVDQNKMLQGLSSLVDGVGAFRTHIGSAHGRGPSPPGVSTADARLAVNAAHTLVIFGMDRWSMEGNA